MSVVKVVCPKCGAPAGVFCYMTGKSAFGIAHRERWAIAPINNDRIPPMRGLFKKSKKKIKKPRHEEGWVCASCQDGKHDHCYSKTCACPRCKR